MKKKSQNFSGYVLAGGKSSRMGEDKAFLEIGGETFAARAINALEPNCRKVKIVLNQSQNHVLEKLPSAFSCIFDRFENRGALGGIHAALQNCETRFAVLLAVDLPFVTAQTIERLGGIAIQAKDLAAVVPRQSDGKLQPLCAVYRVESSLPVVEDLLRKTDSASVRDFLKLLSTRFVEAKDLDADERLFFNVNQPADFQQIRSPIL